MTATAAAMKKRKGSPPAAAAPGRGRGWSPSSVARAALRFLAALHLILLSSSAREASAGKSGSMEGWMRREAGAVSCGSLIV